MVSPDPVLAQDELVSRHAQTMLGELRDAGGRGLPFLDDATVVTF
jgi:hypothetical protein